MAAKLVWDAVSISLGGVIRVQMHGEIAGGSSDIAAAYQLAQGTVPLGADWFLRLKTTGSPEMTGCGLSVPVDGLAYFDGDSPSNRVTVGGIDQVGQKFRITVEHSLP